MSRLREHTSRVTQLTRPRVAELAARKGGGLAVKLLWSRRSGALWVDVLHLATGEHFTVDADPANALDVYYHPFAYCLDAGRELAAAA